MLAADVNRFLESHSASLHFTIDCYENCIDQNIITPAILADFMNRAVKIIFQGSCSAQMLSFFSLHSINVHTVTYLGLNFSDQEPVLLGSFALPPFIRELYFDARLLNIGLATVTADNADITLRSHADLQSDIVTDILRGYDFERTGTFQNGYNRFHIYGLYIYNRRFRVYFCEYDRL
uniref:Receptor ligand binding region domain-containing protein n=1 Tax=Panagrolaimus superbus TaxID=310955 RepID=A0A914XUA9_9BILA